MEKIKITYPNPEKQTDFDNVLERLMRDEKYLHYCASLLTLTEGQYNTSYEFITYRPEQDKDYKKNKPVSKYAAKF